METIIHTPTNRLQDSLDFYKRLNFEVVSGENPTLVSDGKILLEINPHRFAGAGVKIYSDSWTDQVRELEKLTTVHRLENGYLLGDLNGVWIYLEGMGSLFITTE